MSSADALMMQRALELAERGRGHVEPNPVVGAVVVLEGQIVGEGWHERFGGPHAEINALQAAGERSKNATLYVTLEPCCHHGKTPPCTDVIVAAGVKKVVVAVRDPFPAMQGQSLGLLRRAGMEIVEGVLEREATRQNAPFFKLTRLGRPHVIAKWAMSLDGKIATASGESRWITGETAREKVHVLRGRMDGIVAGIVTVLTDDPLLTARPPGPRTPARIILDSQLRLPPSSQLVQTAREVPVLVVHSPQAPEAARRVLEEAGCECLPLQPSRGVPCILNLLDELGRRRFTNVLVEGGAAVLGSFLEAREIDEVWTFIAPKLLGGEKAPSPIAGYGAEMLAQALAVSDWQVEHFGADVLLRGWINRRGDAKK